MKVERVSRDQMALPMADNDGQATSEAFRRLYYDLYTNSNAARAERILEDLSLLLLAKLATELRDTSPETKRLFEGKGDPNRILLPFLRKTFPGLVAPTQRFSLGSDVIRNSLLDLGSIRLSDAPAHVLGEAFQALIGPRLRGDKGQFFTPRSLVKAIVSVIDPQPSESVLDPACGTGGFLAEIHSYQLTRRSPQQRPGALIGVDKDGDLSRLAAALLRVVCGERAVIHNFNSLDSDAWTDVSPAFFDVVITNPPFGARIPVKERNFLRRFDFGHRWRENSGWEKQSEVRDAQDPQLLFLELCVTRLKPGGRLGIVLPEGVFGNKLDGYIWDWLRERGEIYALIDCPRTTFQPSTDTKTNVLFFRRNATRSSRPSPSSSQARVAVVLHSGHDRRGRTTLPDGSPRPDDFLQIARNESDGNSKWKTVEITNPYYMVPRYYIEERPKSTEEADLVTGARTASIGELITSGVLRLSKGHEVGADAYGTGEVPFVRSSDISNLEVRVDPTNAVSEEVYLRYASTQRLRPGDVLMVVDGRYRIGATALLTQTTCHCIVQSHIRILSLQSDELDCYELLYALNLPSVKMRIRDLVFIQSTLGTLGKRLLELRVPILHGEGPWKRRVDQFRETLIRRDEQLTSLRRIASMEEIDL